MSSATLSELLDQLQQGDQLLLPNARAARDLRARFDTHQRLLGLPAWEPAKALTWAQWAKSLWNELVIGGSEQRLLLNAAQEHGLWRQIISSDATNRSLGSLDSLADLAQSAWGMAADHNATQKLQTFASSYDSRTFAVWAESFKRLCAERGYTSSGELNAALLGHLRSGMLAAPASIELIGFGQVLPSQQSLLDAFRLQGTVVLRRQLKAAQTTERLVATVASPTAVEERLLAVKWTRQFLELNRTLEPGSRVALLVPNLPEDRDEIESVLREVLAPELQFIEEDLSSTPWEICGGISLYSLPLISDAMEMIRWTQGALTIERVSSLLLSPYMGSNGTDRDAREAAARVDVIRLRRLLLLRSEIDLRDLLECLQRGEVDYGAQSILLGVQAVHESIKLSGDQTRPRTFAEWMEQVRGVLVAANWPGTRALNALEFEAKQAWESLLDLVSTLDFSGRRVGFAEALETLEFWARQSRFHGPSIDANVQVMSIAEAEGSIFDAILFLHANDTNWPAPERVCPLLPWTLQRTLKMPGSDPALTSSRCRAVTETLLRSSNTVLFSFATEDEVGKLRPSPILTELGIEGNDAAHLVVSTQPFDHVISEVVADDGVIPSLPSYHVSGGASVLKLQAACGFLAFAELRLHATEPKSGTMGLDARESGSVLHRVLQLFWRETRTQDNLRSMSWTERDEMLRRAIDDAVPKRLQVNNGWDRAYLSLQKQRLRSVLQRWLDEELLRGPFVVADVERKEFVTVGPLTLEVRVDRVDSVNNGLFLVDYKTGASADPKQWSGFRPDDPQLPLYTLLAEAEELKGIAFAKVRAGRDMKWQGFQSEEGILPRSRNNIRDIGSLAEEWRHALTRLAEDFAMGRADVRPKSFEVNCARCAQRLLCRVDPSSLAELVDEANGEEEDGLE